MVLLALPRRQRNIEGSPLAITETHLLITFFFFSFYMLATFIYLHRIAQTFCHFNHHLSLSFPRPLPRGRESKPVSSHKRAFVVYSHRIVQHNTPPAILIIICLFRPYLPPREEG